MTACAHPVPGSPRRTSLTRPSTSGEGPAAWHFVTVPVAISDEIAARTEGFTSGFSSVRVHVRIGGTAWSRSLFPDAKQQAYVLPVKKAVRQSEGLDAGTIARAHLELAELRP